MTNALIMREAFSLLWFEPNHLIPIWFPGGSTSQPVNLLMVNQSDQNQMSWSWGPYLGWFENQISHRSISASEQQQQKCQNYSSGCFEPLLGLNKYWLYETNMSKTMLMTSRNTQIQIHRPSRCEPARRSFRQRSPLARLREVREADNVMWGWQWSEVAVDVFMSFFRRRIVELALMGVRPCDISR